MNTPAITGKGSIDNYKMQEIIDRALNPKTGAAFMNHLERTLKLFSPREGHEILRAHRKPAPGTKLMN